jgi:nicotinamide mononucleotide (NMN) deamidase PncC
MLDTSLEQLIAQIHASSHKLAFEFAGAGSQALFWLHSVAGSSRTILEATDRYAAESLADLLGAPPAQAVSRETALAMAAAAYRRAMRLTDGAAGSFGVGCTAAIATDRARRGADRCWIAVQDRAGMRVYGLEMTKGARDRHGEEALVSRLLLRAIAVACGIEDRAPLDLRADERVQAETIAEADPLVLLLEGAARSVTVAPDGRHAADESVHGVLVSGSFNPLHVGHEGLAHAASQLLGLPAVFELPVLNADKPPLGYAEIERRLDQFRGRYTVALSREPLFVGKAALFPSCVFAIGYDTVERLVDLRYYGGAAGRDAALAAIRAHGCRILVAGRVKDGAFRTLADIALPDGFRDLFIELPERAFRLDLSSTAIRAWRSAEQAS